MINMRLRGSSKRVADATRDLIGESARGTATVQISVGAQQNHRDGVMTATGRLIPSGLRFLPFAPR